MTADDSPTVSRHLSRDELEQRIDTESDASVQRRLVFIRALYHGESLQTATSIVGTSESTGQEWLEQWNDSGIDGFQSDEETAASPTLGTTESGPDQPATVEYLNYEVLDDHGWEPEDPDLFEKAADAELSEEDHGTFTVAPDETILNTAEDEGHVWPYACRGGACANCVSMVTQGEIDMPVNQILPDEAMKEKNARLTCIGTPATSDIKLIYNAKHLDYLDELRLPPQQVDPDDY